ncbi:MAG: hypothetical protein CL869_00160 [Cytophagia bacterium]|nr:hypothetical protein [Cytophagia bacterium]
MKIFYRLLIISMFGAIYADCEDYATEADCGMHDECEWHADEMACEDAGGHDDHEGGHHSFEATALSVGSTTFTISIIHQGHADYTSLPVLVNVTEEDTCLTGDVNGDSTLSILDIVAMVSGVINGNTDSLECGDYTGDGIVDILDIVQLVQFIINNRTLDATSATININESNVTLEADGYIGGVQMTLSHNSNFTLELTENAYIAQSNTELNETILVVVNPESDILFTYEGDFIITEHIVANSHEQVSTTISEMTFNLGSAYPNPFNPTTTLSLTIPSSGYVNVAIYNLVGQQIASLVDGNMDLGTYNLTWNAQNISSGMYLVRAEYAGNVSTQKLMLIK